MGSLDDLKGVTVAELAWAEHAQEPAGATRARGVRAHAAAIPRLSELPVDLGARLARRRHLKAQSARGGPATAAALVVGRGGHHGEHVAYAERLDRGGARDVQVLGEGAAGEARGQRCPQRERPGLREELLALRVGRHEQRTVARRLLRQPTLADAHGSPLGGAVGCEPQSRDLDHLALRHGLTSPRVDARHSEEAAAHDQRRPCSALLVVRTLHVLP